MTKLLAFAVALIVTAGTQAAEQAAPHGIDYVVAYYSCKPGTRRPCGTDAVPMVRYKTFQDDRSGFRSFADMEKQVGTYMWEDSHIRQTPRSNDKFYD